MLTRGDRAKEMVSTLGAREVGDAFDRPPVALEAAIFFAPVGTLVPGALDVLDAGGTLAIAGIHLTDDLDCTSLHRRHGGLPRRR